MVYTHSKDSPCPLLTLFLCWCLYSVIWSLLVYNYGWHYSRSGIKRINSHSASHFYHWESSSRLLLFLFSSSLLLMPNFSVWRLFSFFVNRSHHSTFILQGHIFLLVIDPLQRVPYSGSLLKLSPLLHLSTRMDWNSLRQLWKIVQIDLLRRSVELFADL